MSRIPIRIRLTLAFVLALGRRAGRPRAGRLHALRGQPERQHRPGAALARDGHRGAGRARRARGFRARATSGSSRPRTASRRSSTRRAGSSTEARWRTSRALLSPEEIAAAREGSLTLEREDAVEEGDPARLFAVPVGEFTLVVGQAIDDNEEALATLRLLLAVGLPIALDSRLARRIRGRRRRAAARRGDAQEGRRRQRGPAGRAAAAAAGGRRDPAARRDAERDARAARGGARARARVRRRREPRAADAARQPEDGARARAAARPHDGRAARARFGPRPRRPTASAGLPTTCWCWRARTAARCRSGSRRSGRGSCSTASPRSSGTRGTTCRWTCPTGSSSRATACGSNRRSGTSSPTRRTHGDGAVRVSARQRDGTVELHVEDEGEGLPPGFAERAFERFTRADEARAGGGAGLGLAIVAAIARAHGGPCGLLAARDAARTRGSRSRLSSKTHPARRTTAP